MARHRRRLLRERAAADREPLALALAAEVRAHLRRDVACGLAHHGVGDGGDARGDHHPDAVDRARVIDLEGGGGKVFHDAPEQQEEVELLGVKQRRPPHARRRVVGRLGLWWRQQAREGVAHQSDLQKGGILHAVRLDRDQSAQPVAVTRRRHRLGEGRHVGGQLQEVDRRVVGELLRRPRVDGLAAQQTVVERVEVRRVRRRLPLPRKGARVLPQQSDAVGGDELALGVEEDEG